MSKYPKLTHYVSEIDQDLQKFDKEHPEPSASQKKEQEKYAKIYRLRDTVNPSKKTDIPWENF